MLSGRRPRGSSNTPGSGKIGMVSGSAAASLITPASGEHQRRQPPPRRQGQRIGRPHSLEEFDQLLARRLLVPVAIALEQGQELVDGRLALAGAEQGGRQLKARLVVVRVLLQALLQCA